ncbi:TIR domain-containing protein [Rhizobium leguminosarum]|uniref:TIR domain-containing protein n=1 Tax=Rhizobium leguminosarum TaxID=384 RepID=UPI0009B73316|nr:TIR domain-containing protein [Rhizobium leguminosarum]
MHEFTNNSTRNYLALLDALTKPKPPEPPSPFSYLAQLLGDPPSAPVRSNPIQDALINALLNPASTPSPPADPYRLNALLAGLDSPSIRQTTKPVAPDTRRKVFFSFHYDDVIRVNNVRHSEQFKAKAREVPQSFYDRSLWERRQLTNPDSLKEMIRTGVKGASVICALIGTETYARRWVRYEIARAIIDGKGLVGVHINGLRHHQHRIPHPRGPDPFEYMGIGLMQDGTYRIFEFDRSGWRRYQDHLGSVPFPKYLRAPAVGYIMPLARGVVCYDYAAQSGSTNIPLWLDQAAGRMGR